MESLSNDKKSFLRKIAPGTLQYKSSLGGSGITIYLETGQIDYWSPLIRGSKHLQFFSKVWLTKHRDTMSDVHTDEWHVSLVPEKETERFVVKITSKYDEARSLADELATVLNLTLEEDTAGFKVVREAGRLNETLREKILRTEKGRSLPPEPPNMKTIITPTPDGYALRIPDPKKGKIPVLKTASTLIFVILCWFLILKPAIAEFDTFDIVLTALILLIILGKVGMSLLSDWSRRFSWAVMVTVSPAFFRIEHNEGYRKKVKEFPADKLRDVAMPDVLKEMGVQMLGGEIRTLEGKPVTRYTKWLLRQATEGEAIAVVLERETLTFGECLPHAELEYLCALIRKTMVGKN